MKRRFNFTGRKKILREKISITLNRDGDTIRSAIVQLDLRGMNLPKDALVYVEPFSPRPTLLVTMGGSDPCGMTLCAARALAGLDPVFRVRFVIGPGFGRREETAQAIVALKSNFETIEGADSLTTEYASADLALAAFGVTAYELAAFGVPALYLCTTEDHALSASAFELAGMGVSLGLADQATDDAIAKAVWALLADAERRREMRSAGLMTIDGGASARIASDLAGALAARRTVKEKRTAI